MDLSQVLPEVFVGSCPRSTEDIDHLRQKFGVTAVLNLQTEEDMNREGCDWHKLHGHYRRSTMVVRRVPVTDFDGESLRKHLPDCVRALNELLGKGHTVFVHCTMGIGRSPSVVVAYLNWCQQYEWDRALALLLRCRKCSPNMEAIRLASEDLLGDAA